MGSAAPNMFHERICDVAEKYNRVNNRIAEVEAYGLDFPSGALYATFCAFDYLSAIEEIEHAYEDAASDEERREIEREWHECINSVEAMLEVACYHASVSLVNDLTDKADNIEQRYKWVDVSKYHDYACYKDLEHARERYGKILNRMTVGHAHVIALGDSVLDLHEVLLNEPQDRLASFVRDIDDWVDAARMLYEAQRGMIPVYRKSRSARNLLDIAITVVLLAISAAFIVASVIRHFC